MTSVSSTSATQVALPAPAEREKLHKAAQAFEALLVKQMLSSARAANFGNDLLSGKGSETFTAMQDERFAQIAADRGALGFAKVIEAQLAKRVESPSRLREGLGVGQSEVGAAHPRPLPQAGGEK